MKTRNKVLIGGAVIGIAYLLLNKNKKNTLVATILPNESNNPDLPTGMDLPNLTPSTNVSTESVINDSLFNPKSKAEQLAEQEMLILKAKKDEEERLAQLERIKLAEQAKIAEQSRLAEEKRLSDPTYLYNTKIAELQRTGRLTEVARQELYRQYMQPNYSQNWSTQAKYYNGGTVMDMQPQNSQSWSDELRYHNGAIMLE